MNSVSTDKPTQHITANFTISKNTTYVRLVYTISGPINSSFERIIATPYAPGSFSYVTTPGVTLAAGRYTISVDLFYGANTSAPYAGGFKTDRPRL